MLPSSGPLGLTPLWTLCFSIISNNPVISRESEIRKLVCLTIVTEIELLRPQINEYINVTLWNLNNVKNKIYIRRLTLRI